MLHAHAAGREGDITNHRSVSIERKQDWKYHIDLMQREGPPRHEEAAKRE